MTRSRLRSKLLVLTSALLAAAACDRSTPAELSIPAPQHAVTVGSTLLECPTDQTKSVTGTIDILGGTLTLDGHSISLPAGAVLLPTTFTLTVPASNYMAISITANGQHSFQFEKAVSVTISYQRCSRSNISKSDLTAWHYDSATNTLLEHMGGSDNKISRAVTFGTTHLSEYVLAN